jgi:hypothetical protein
LHLTLPRQFFAEIVADTKHVEYRSQATYWGHEYDAIPFRIGYSRIAPEMLVEFLDLHRCGKGRKAYYAIRLGPLLKIKRWPTAAPSR